MKESREDSMIPYLGGTTMTDKQQQYPKLTYEQLEELHTRMEENSYWQLQLG
ncbi:hypothetical protein ACWA2B_09835 [Paenibacillus sp. CMM36]